MVSSKVLGEMQNLLTRLYDAPIDHEVSKYLVTDRALAAELSGCTHDKFTDEQMLVSQDDDGVHLALYIDSAVLDRLSRRNPWQELDEENISDYCTALEGVSHFHYMIWSLNRARHVSLLELEVQAEVDKYASALWLMTRQNGGQFPASLHGRLFEQVSFAACLDEESRHRYTQANRHAARFCRWLESNFLKVRRVRPERWLAALRRFHRFGHHEKLRYAAG
jgi:hypothetical protein